MRLERVPPCADDVPDDVVEIDAAPALGFRFARQRQEVADDAPGARRLVIDRLEREPRLLVGFLLQQ